MARKAALLLALCASAHVFATTRARAVRPVTDGVYSGMVVDATTQRPVVDAEVVSGLRSSKTDSRGAFSIVIPTGRFIGMIVRRTGYEELQVTVSLPATASVATPPVVSPTIPLPTPAPGLPSTIAMTPRAPVTVKMTSGQTVLLDADSIQFAYVIPFSSPSTSETASFCRKDGTSFEPDRADFARIVGPASAMSNDACCKLGKVLAVNVEMKDGEKTQVFFSDSCFGYDVVLSGRERESAQFVYLKFTDIAAADFP
jgi:hypothetical protein